LKLPDVNIYYVYIVTDKEKVTLETGVAGALNVRLNRLELNADNDATTGSNTCIYLLYWEKFTDVHEAMAREEKIRKMSKAKKEELIKQVNLQLRFLNDEVKAF
jgi:putative endonuclease